jgi:hypothetical protein
MQHEYNLSQVVDLGRVMIPTTGCKVPGFPWQGLFCFLLLQGMMLFIAVPVTADALQGKENNAARFRFVDAKQRFSFDLACAYLTESHGDDGDLIYELNLKCNKIQIFLSELPPSGNDEAALRRLLKAKQQKALKFLDQSNGDYMIGEPDMQRFANHWALTYRFKKDGRYAIETQIARARGFDLFLTVVAPTDAPQDADQTVALVHRSFSVPPIADAEADEDKVLAMKGMIKRVGLHRVFEEHRWNSAALARVIQLLDADARRNSISSVGNRPRRNLRTLLETTLETVGGCS